MCELDLKNEYFRVPLDQNSRKFIRYLWTFYEFIRTYIHDTSVYKVTENSNLTPQKNQHQW